MESLKGINKIAGIVLSKSNSPSNEFSRNMHISSMSPLPYKGYFGPPEFNLTGWVVGRLDVIGIYYTKSAQNSSKWVTRCRCGRYHVNRGKALRKAKETRYELSCHDCARTNQLKRYT